MEYAITGITGKVGGEVARNLIDAGHTVRAVMRDATKAKPWADRGCSVAIAEMDDAEALTAAFTDVDGVFVLLPANFDPSPGFVEVKSILRGMTRALISTKPQRTVCISTIGAHAQAENLLTSLTLMEQTLGELPLPMTFLRPAWFMENSSWDITPAKELGTIQSFLQPLDKAFPMVATADVGRVAAELLQETWKGRRIVELEGPARISPNDLASTFTALLARDVRAEIVPRTTWTKLFTDQGMRHPTPRIRMLDGFNEGWIDFESGGARSVRGTTSLETVLRKLIDTL